MIIQYYLFIQFLRLQITRTTVREKAESALRQYF